ncbi:universal stress protein [Larsenimonas suaedae]|uniref:Universal stress protein n=1 Tax=Larsenimonas suaedae TaxID=1851019 RepID=A0ABU1GRD4_9GAMM|nr:universal stress protein [Larsenimonas suaedae]MCM2972620.1 universal stress protein [Larsenimonas suaedae]MDR5894584.1 universal stress protein [Larsenimonas suaedae]
MYRSLLVPLDGSNHAVHALKLASRMIDEHADLYVITIPEVPQATDQLGISVGAAPLDYTYESAKELADTIIRESIEKAALGDRKVHAIVRDGPPVAVILNEARERNVDGIVMGSRGLSDLKGLVVGSVSHKISHLAPCPVITVHLPDERA